MTPTLVAERSAAALAKLNVSESDVAVVPRVTPQIRIIMAELRRMGREQKTETNVPSEPIYYVDCSDDPEARRFRESWYSVPKSWRKALPLEAYCAASGVSSVRLLSIIVSTVVRLSASASAILAAAYHPQVVRKTVEMALTDEGHEDRVVLHKATGFLPQPKGSSTTINVQQRNEQVSVAAIAAPPPEQTIRRLADRLNAAKGLPPAVPSALPIADADDSSDILVMPPREAQSVLAPARDVVDSGWEDDSDGADA